MFVVFNKNRIQWGKVFMMVVDWSLIELNIVYNHWNCYEQLKIVTTDLIDDIMIRYD